MLISFTCNNVGTGGAERVICNLANRMAKDGHIVHIICYKKFDSFYYELEKNVSILELDPLINNRKLWIQRKLSGIINLFRLYHAIKGSDKIISFYTRQNCYSILMGHLRKIPVICAERDHFFLNDGKINHKLRNMLYPHADGFIHQTNMAQEWLRKNEGVQCDDIVIPNPLWIDDFPNREPIPGKIVAVGRLEKQKNYEEMIDAFYLVNQKRKEATLHIFGEGSCREELALQIDALGLRDVVFLEGMTKNVVEVYRQADIFVMFSHGEGYPNALMEALAMGVPSVSSDCPVGGPRDMIQNGKNGFLVPCSDKHAFSEKIIELLDNPDLRSAFSANSLSIRDSNCFESIYEKIMEYVKEIKFREHN